MDVPKRSTQYPSWKRKSLIPLKLDGSFSSSSVLRSLSDELETLEGYIVSRLESVSTHLIQVSNYNFQT